MANQLEGEEVLAYAEKVAEELHEAAEHVRQAAAAFQATLRDFQRWVEAARGTTVSLSPEQEPEPEEAPAQDPVSSQWLGTATVGTATAGAATAGAATLVSEPSAAVDRRAGFERRSGEERRVFFADGLAARIIRSIDRRKRAERRVGGERRRAGLVR